MKYINSYKLFESSNINPRECAAYLEDIFREMEDIGISIDIGIDKNGIISIDINTNKYNLEDYIDTYLSAEDYLKTLHYSIYEFRVFYHKEEQEQGIRKYSRHNYRNIDEFKIIHGEKITSIEIYFNSEENKISW